MTKTAKKNNHPFTSRLMTEPIGIMEERITDLLMAFDPDLVASFNMRMSDKAMKMAEEDDEEERVYKAGLRYEVVADWMGEAIPKTEIKGDVAVVPLRGTVIKGGGNLSRWLAMAELDDFMANLDVAVKSEAKGIFLSIDSPGGFTIGVAEAAAAVVEAGKSKPVMAYTSGLMASAAYWIGAGAHSLHASGSSIVGSIGAYMMVTDASEWLESMGIKVEVFRSGQFKGAGSGYESLTKEQREYFQERVSTNADEFKSFVSSRRTLISSKDMQGQAYSGRESATKGFVHSLIDTEEKAIEKFSATLSDGEEKERNINE